MLIRKLHQLEIKLLDPAQAVNRMLVNRQGSDSENINNMD
jgi:hypothetical protein